MSRITAWLTAAAAAVGSVIPVPPAAAAEPVGVMPGGVVGVAPARLLDTRSQGVTVDAEGQGAGRLLPGAAARVRVAGRAGVPGSGAAGAVLTVTAVDPAGPGWLSVWPCDQSAPLASNVNWTDAGSVVAGSVVAMLGEDGDVCVRSNVLVDVVVDVSGWIGAWAGGVPDAGGVGLVQPARLVDTRPGESTVDGAAAGGGRVSAGGVVEVPVTGRAGVPSTGVAGVLLNITAVAPDAAGYLSVYPCAQVRPLVSNVNWTAPGAVVANRVTVGLGSADRVCVFSLVATDVVVDVAGWVASGDPAGVGAVALTRPGRLVDTRPAAVTADGVNRPGRVTAGGVLRVPVLGRMGVPSAGVSAALLNVTAVNPQAAGYLTSYPCPPRSGGGRPLASDVNWTAAGSIVANATITGIGDGGEVCVFALVDTDVVVDVFGYVTGPVHAEPPTPPEGAPGGGAPPVTVPGSDQPSTPPAPGDVDGDGFVDDVPVDVAGQVPVAVLPGGGRWEWRLTEVPKSLDGFVSVAAASPADVGRRVWVEVLDPDEVVESGLQGAAVSIVPVDELGAVDVDVRVDYSRFEQLFGGDWSERLTAVATEGRSALDASSVTPLATQRNDLSEQAVTFSATFPETGATTHDFEQSVDDTGGMIAGLLAGVAGSTGTYGATSLTAQGGWSHGGSSGGFNWSYPLGGPDSGTGGPQPGFALTYSSQAVDGMTSNNNSQASHVGLGWSLAGQAFIERSYTSCQLVGGAIADLCWDGHQVSLVLDGVSSRLVPIDSQYREWRLERDNGWRVFRLSGAPSSDLLGGAGLVDEGHGDGQGEFWEIHTVSGDVYRFGYGEHFGQPLHSAWTVPVVGAHAGDPCRTKPGSVCQQAWRWNLDLVTDAVGRRMVLSYQPEFGTYAMLGRPYASQRYARGGFVDRVWWGIPAGGGVDQARHMMVFSTGSRCEPLGNNCPLTTANLRAFPDVPTDLHCDPGVACWQWSPSFYTARRLVAATTATRVDGAWVAVNQWRFTHELVGELKRLWLRSIELVGAPDEAGLLPEGITPDPTRRQAKLPAIRFESLLGGVLANRWDANPAAGVSPIRLPRITTIRDELGGQTQVAYTQPDPCNGQPAGGWAANTTNCYPEWWAPTGGTPGWGVFNVWLVDSVTQGTISPNAAPGDTGAWADTPITTRYAYHGGAGYRHAERRAVSFAFQSWSQYRGYSRVTATTGPSTTETTYFRGLHENRTASGGTAVVHVTTSTGPGPSGAEAAPITVPDHDWLAGRVFETRTLDANGRELAGTIAVPHQLRANDSVDLGIRSLPVGYVADPLQSRLMVTQDTWTRAADAAGNIHAHWALARTTFEPGWGLPVETFESGDTMVTDDIKNARCTRTEYRGAFTSSGSGVLVADRPSKIEILPNTCNDTPVATTTYAWDAAGRVISEDRGSEVTWLAAYGADAYGRLTSVTDPNGNVTRIERRGGAVPGPAGLVVERVTTVNAGGLETVGYVGVDGQTIGTTDWQGDTTAAVFDGLGRVTEVYSPDPDQGGPASLLTERFVYHTLAANGGAAWAHPSLGAGVESFRQLTRGHAPQLVQAVFLDGLGRTAEVHTTSPAGHTISGTVYDERGLATRSFAPYPGTGRMAHDPAGLVRLHGPAGLQPASGFEHVVDTAFDALARPVSTTETDSAGRTYVTTTTYNGFTTRVVSPGRGAIETRTDPYGQVIESTDFGSGRRVRNTYDPRGLLLTTGPMSARVENTYDSAGRLTSTTEPNSGTTKLTLDPAGNVVSRTDAAGVALRMEYDALHRLVARYDGSTLLASWTFHPAGTEFAGLPASTTSYEDGATYTQRTTGYDGWDRPLGTQYEVELANGERFEYTESVEDLQPSGAATRTVLGAFGPKPAETLTAVFDDLGNVVGLEGDERYLTATSFDELGRTVERRLNGGDLVRGYEFNARRQLSALEALSGGTQVQNDRYEFDDAGSITAIDHAAPVDGGTHKECFTTDAGARLIRAYTVPSGRPCTDPAVLTTAGGVGPDGVGYDESWSLSSDGLMLSRTRQTSDDPEPDQANLCYGPGPAQVSFDGSNAYEYDANGARVSTGAYESSAAYLQLFETPRRALDTRDLDRDGVNTDAPLMAGDVLTVDLAAYLRQNDVPVGEVAGVMLNVTVVDPVQEDAAVAVYPTGDPHGTVIPAVRAAQKETTAGLVVSRVSPDEQITVRALDHSQHVVVDVLGAYVNTDTEQAAGRVKPLDVPQRVYDSRTEDGPLTSHEYRTVDAKDAGVPDDAVGLIVTVTAINADHTDGAEAYVSVLPGGFDTTKLTPGTSTVNLGQGAARAGQAAAYVTPDELDRLVVFASNGSPTPVVNVADVVIDVVAYVTGPNSPISAEGLYTILPPVEIATITPTTPDEPLQLAGRACIADDALAVTGNTTITTSTTGGYVTVVAPGVATGISTVTANPNETVTAYTTTGLNDEGLAEIRLHHGVTTATFTLTGYYRTDLPHTTTPPGDPTQLTWNSEHHLTTTTHGTTTTTYHYWPNGRRVAQHTPNGTTYYLGTLQAHHSPTGHWDDIRQTITTNGTTLASRHTTTTNGTTATRTDYLLGNHQGSITTTIQATTSQATTRWYTPYGAARGPQPTHKPTTTGFLNQHEDPTGLTYLNNRYHDPTLGHFISIDPLLTTTWEPYVYASANPATYSDPSGLAPSIRPLVDGARGCGWETCFTWMRDGAVQKLERRGEWGRTEPVGARVVARAIATVASFIPGADTVADPYLCGDSAAAGNAGEAAIDCGAAALPVIGGGWFKLGNKLRKLLGIGDEVATSAVRLGVDDLTGSTLSNYNRFVKNLPAAAETPTITNLADGAIEFSARVPATNIPGSYATYTKVVGPDGVTISFIKTTIAPDGSIVSVKVKYP